MEATFCSACSILWYRRNGTLMWHLLFVKWTIRNASFWIARSIINFITFRSFFIYVTELRSWDHRYECNVSSLGLKMSNPWRLKFFYIYLIFNLHNGTLTEQLITFIEIHKYIHISFRKSIILSYDIQTWNLSGKKKNSTHKQNHRRQYNTINKHQNYSLQNNIVHSITTK